MADARPWYREPETFIAVAALVVSLSAVVVGIYEARLQRDHDRAEVWPHVEIATFTSPQGAALYLENTGLGPAIVKSVVVTVDDAARASWRDVLSTLYGGTVPPFAVTTVVEHALRGGDKVQMIGLSSKDLPPNFWDWIRRVRVAACYESAFHDRWIVKDDRRGGNSVWLDVSDCPQHTAGTDF